MLETLAGRISLLFSWRLSSACHKRKVQSKIPSFDSTILFCSNKSINEQEAWRNSVGNKIIGKQWMTEEESAKRGKDTIEIWWQEDEEVQKFSASKPMDGQMNIADTWTTSRRSTSLAPHPGIQGTGTRAPSRWHATMKIVKLDR